MSTDYRALCAELIKAVLADNSRLDILHIARGARAADLLERLAAPAPPAAGEGLTDKELFRIASDCQAIYIADDVDYDNCSEVVAAMRAAIAADRARYRHQPAPPAAGEVGELVEFLRDWGDDYADEGTKWHRAADLLERLAAPPAAGEVGELVQWIHREGVHSGYADQWLRAADLLSQRHPAPVPVRERLPGPEDCDAEGRCWWSDSQGLHWELCRGFKGASHWLPAHALPLPAGEVK